MASPVSLATAHSGASCPIDHILVNSNKMITSKFLFIELNILVEQFFSLWASQVTKIEK
jgi:hypothetical protein